MIKIALLSVSDDTGLTELAQSLHELGYNLVASSGTRAKIESTLGHQTSINDMEYYAAEAIGKMRPLAREEATGVIAGRMHSDRASEIEIVVCNFRRPRVNRDEIRDEIIRDLGGPHLANAAVMSHRFVIVDPADYEKLINLLRSASDDDLDSFRTRMDAKTLAAVGDYHRQLAFYHRMVRQPLLPKFDLFGWTP